MRRIMLSTAAIGIATVLLAFGLTPSPARAQGLIGPLACGDPACIFHYQLGAYTYMSINTVLDHSLVKNGNGLYQYGTKPGGGGDGIIKAFNGETASGAIKAGDPSFTCITGVILLKPAPTAPATTAMVNNTGCNTGTTTYIWSSYDEHPGYDYRAICTQDLTTKKCIVGTGTPVRAAAAGTVVNNGGMMCVLTNISSPCSAWNYVGIDHGNNYISQYGHLSLVLVYPGQRVSQGQMIGYSGNTSPATAPKDQLGPHLHFEVIKVIPGHSNIYSNPLNYAIVDPYGWVGNGTDPLTVQFGVPSVKLWQ